MNSLYYFYQLPRQQSIVTEFFPDAPPLMEMLTSKLALTLVNNHHTLAYPSPVSPSVVEVGGMHIAEKPKPLPKVSHFDRYVV